MIMCLIAREVKALRSLMNAVLHIFYHLALCLSFTWFISCFISFCFGVIMSFWDHIFYHHRESTLAWSTPRDQMRICPCCPMTFPSPQQTVPSPSVTWMWKTPSSLVRHKILIRPIKGPKRHNICSVIKILFHTVLDIEIEQIFLTK